MSVESIHDSVRRTVGTFCVDLPSGSDRIGELLEDLHGGIPIDACVCDAHTSLQRGQTTAIGGRWLLSTLR